LQGRALLLVDTLRSLPTADTLAEASWPWGPELGVPSALLLAALKFAFENTETSTSSVAPNRFRKFHMVHKRLRYRRGQFLKVPCPGWSQDLKWVSYVSLDIYLI